MTNIRDALETNQVPIYFASVTLGVAAALLLTGTEALEAFINPALAFMLFVTFLQVPVGEIGRAFSRFRFLGALLVSNFVFIPFLALALVQFLPPNPMVHLGVLLVLLAPCIDYVVTFAHLGKADARVILAATPVLLLVQILLLPIYLTMFLGAEAASLVELGPFVHAFVWLIAAPLAFAIITQTWGNRNATVAKASSMLGLCPVPATALVLLIVAAAVVPQLAPAMDAALSVIPVYVAFAVIAPLLGWLVARMFRLEAPEGRSVAFSAATRNSLVVLPLALAVPNAVPLLPAVIVTQTLVELISELVYVRLAPAFGRSKQEELRTR